MPTFDFSLEPTFDLVESGAKLIEYFPGPKEVEINLRDGELFVNGRLVVPYTPSDQATWPHDTTVEMNLPKISGLPIAHPMLAQVLYEHPELIPKSLRYYLEMIEGAAGIIFPTCKVKSWTGSIGVPEIFSIDGLLHFTQISLDRLPNRRPILIEVGTKAA